jgi:rhodanese-related sulfurtransferase
MRSRIAHGFGSGSGMACVADRRLRTPAGRHRELKTAKKFETFQSSPPANDESVNSNYASNPVISEETDMDRAISTKGLKSRLDQKQVTVVETLAPERYREAPIPGALNIPPEQIRELAPQLLPNKNAEIVTYCANTHGHASEYAARELAAMGYKNVAHYPEGKQGWMEAGLPVEKAA